jgi:hypothetical protein
VKVGVFPEMLFKPTRHDRSSIWIGIIDLLLCVVCVAVAPNKAKIER